MRRIALFFSCLVLNMLAGILAPEAMAAKVLHYSFDSGAVTSGSVVTDLSGSSHDATVINNDAVTTAGKFGKALRVNGKSWLRVANPSTLIFGDVNVTVMMWIKTTTASATLFAKDQDGVHVSGDKNILIGSTTTTGTLFVGHNGVGNVTTTQLVNNGIWHHVAWVQRKDASGSNEMWDVYLDGVAVITNGLNKADKVDPANFTVSFLRKLTGGGAPSNYYGDVDEIKVFDTALDAAAVQLEYTTNGVAPSRIHPGAWTGFE